MSLNLEQKTYFLITGASRGIGQTMAIQVATKLKTTSVMVLLARNQEGLAETKVAIEAATLAVGKAIKVLTFSIDLAQATATDFQRLLRESLEASAEQPSHFERAFIIHNAASVGDVSKKAIDVADTAAWTAYYHMNVFSVIALNCEFFRIFQQVPKLVVNISSKCGVEPFASMSFYCSGKAARDMYFRVLAVEEDKDTLVLNYAPGAIDTDMSVQVQNETINIELSSEFKKLRDTKMMLTTEQTTNKFLKLLEEQKFKSGAHVDYWD